MAAKGLAGDEDKLRCPSPLPAGCDERDVVLAAVRTSGYALQYASDRLRGDLEVARTAVAQSPEAVAFASAELRRDKALVLPAVRACPSALRFAKELQGDKEVVLAAVERCGYAVKYAEPWLRDDEEVMLLAGREAAALRYGSARLRRSVDFVLRAVQGNVGVLHHVDEGLRRSKDFALRCVDCRAEALRCLEETFRADREVVLRAVRGSGHSLQFAAPHLKEKNDLIAVLLKKAKLPESSDGGWRNAKVSSVEEARELERIVEDTTEDNIRLRNDIKIMSDELRKLLPAPKAAATGAERRFRGIRGHRRL